MSAVAETPQAPQMAPMRRRSVTGRKAADLVVKVFSWVGALFGIALGRPSAALAGAERMEAAGEAAHR